MGGGFPQGDLLFDEFISADKVSHV
jgi:hypothetical protein